MKGSIVIIFYVNLEEKKMFKKVKSVKEEIFIFGNSGPNLGVEVNVRHTGKLC